MPFRYSFIYVLGFMLAALNAAGQNSFSISGTVKNADGENLPGAAILLHELNKGVSTDVNGKYTFTGIKTGKYHLHVEYIGYESGNIDVEITNRDITADVELKKTSLELRGIVVEESLLKTKQQYLSQPIEIISAKEIEKHSSGNIANALDRMAGLSSINTGTNIGKPVIRGFSFNRVLVTENGIKQEGQQWGADHGLEIDQYNVDRIEILRGASAIMYGSDAMGGVINIRPAAPPKLNSVQGGVALNGKSNNQLLGLSVNAGVNVKNNYLKVRFSSQDFADFSVPADSFTYIGYVLPLENGKLKNTAGRERNVSATIGTNRSWGYSSITVSNVWQQFGFFAGSHGIPRAYQLTDDGDPRNIGLPYQEVNHLKIISNSSFMIGKNWLETDLGFQENVRKEFSTPHSHGFAPLPGNNLEHELTLKTFSGNLRLKMRNNERFQKTTGISFQFQDNRRGGFNFLLPDYWSATVGGFIYALYRASDKLSVNGGLRFDYGHIDISQTLQPLYNPDQSIDHYSERNPAIVKDFYNFSGSLGISYAASEKFTLKVNFGKTFKMPVTAELAANGVHHGTFRHEAGDSSLTSEDGYQTDIGFYFNSKNARFSFTPFFNYFPNFIFLTPTAQFSPLPDAGQIYKYEQAKAINTGLEVVLDWHITKTLHASVNGEFVYAQNMDDFYPIPFIPPASALADLEYEFKKLPKFLSEAYIGVNTSFVAPQNLTARNEKKTSGYILPGLAAGSSFKLGKQELAFSFEVQNILNQKYFNHLNRYRLLNLPEPGRNFIVSLRLPLEYYLKKK